MIRSNLLRPLPRATTRATRLARSALLACIALAAMGALSANARADDLARPAVRIGVTKGSTSERTLPARFKNAKIVPAESVKLAVGMLGRGELDTYATNKPTLFEMSDSMPGARVLDGNWGLEHMAVAIPKGREQGLALVAAFVKDARSNGLLERIQQQHGLRGAVKAEPK